MLAALPLGEFLSPCNSKRDELHQGAWHGEMGRICLDFLVRLAGLSWPELSAGDAERINKTYLSPEKISTVSLPDAARSAGPSKETTERRSPASTPDSCSAPSPTHGVIFVSHHADVICIR